MHLLLVYSTVTLKATVLQYPGFVAEKEERESRETERERERQRERV